MRDQEILKKARLLREQEHRLKPTLRLRTLDEIQQFIHRQGLVSVFGGNELPNVISAILGREWKPSGKGFTAWEDWWSIKISGQNAGHALADLDRAEDIISTKIFRKTKTLVSASIWPILNPIVEHYSELARGHKTLSELEWRILKRLDTKGPTRTDRLRSQLKLEGKTHTSRFHQALSRLESYGLIVGYEDPQPEAHLHANIWQLWKTKIGPRVKGGDSMPYDHFVRELLAKTIDAAVLAQEKEIGNWFQWNNGILNAKDELLESGKIIRVGSFLVTPRCI